MKVWIEQEFCTGDGLCEDLCPDVFEMRDDGLAHVKGDETGCYGQTGHKRPRGVGGKRARRPGPVRRCVHLRRTLSLPDQSALVGPRRLA